MLISRSFNPKLRDYGRPVGFDVFHADERDVLKMPLVHQPNTVWEYGTGIDWAGIVLERGTGVRLNDWIQQNIMEPLNIKNVNMLPTPEMKKELAFMHQKWPGSSAAEERDHIYREPIVAETDDEKKHLFHSGGAGCYAKPAEYVQILATLLNDGKKAAVDDQLRLGLKEQLDITQSGMTSITDGQRTVNLIKEEMMKIDRLCAEAQNMIKDFPFVDKIAQTHRNFGAVPQAGSRQQIDVDLLDASGNAFGVVGDLLARSRCMPSSNCTSSRGPSWRTRMSPSGSSRTGRGSAGSR